MDWDDLRFVRAVGLHGTLAAAGATLRIHPSTVLRRINRVEQRLGVRLFERNREGFSLTPAGEDALAAAERLATELDELELRLAGRDTRPAGSVRLTTTDTIFLGMLAPMLAGFRRRYPAVQLEVVTANPFYSLSKRDADVALRPTASPPDTLVGRRIADVATAVYGAAGYLAEAPPRTHLEEHVWIAPDDSLATLPSARWLKERLPDVRPVLECNSVASIFAAARGGVGLAALPCFLGDSAPELERVTDPLAELTVDLWLLTHRDLRRVARIRALLDYLFEAFDEQTSLLDGTRLEKRPPAKRPRS